MLLTSQRNIVVINHYKPLFSVHIWINNDKKWNVPVRNNTEKKDKQTNIPEALGGNLWVTRLSQYLLQHLSPNGSFKNHNMYLQHAKFWIWTYLPDNRNIYIFPFSSQCMQYDIFSLFVLFSLFHSVPAHSGICDCNHHNVFPKLEGIGKTRGFY